MCKETGCVTLGYSQQRKIGMLLAKEIGARLYFRVSKSPSSKYSGEVSLGFERLLHRLP